MRRPEEMRFDSHASVTESAQVELAAGIPFVSDKDLEIALTSAGVDQATADAIVEENSDARVHGLRASLTVLALIALVGLFATGKIPTKQPGGVTTPTTA